MSNATPSTFHPGPHRVALAAAALTWPLLLVGGSVSVYRVGLAVPDWPTTFGINMFLYDFWNASWGVFIEHSHRLYGSAVGVACIVLASWFAVAERRGWMKGLGALALVGVIVQGFLGGYRVRNHSTLLAFVHGCTAELFFAFLVTLCVLTGRVWGEVGTARDDPDHLRRRSAVMLGLVAMQIVAGAWIRHYGSVAALVVHAILATAVWGHAAWLAWRVEARRGDVPTLVPSARALLAAATGQVAWGVVAWWSLRPFDGIAREVSLRQAVIRVGHQGLGALLLAAAVVLCLRAFRGLRGARVEAAAGRVPGRALEAVA